MTHSGHEEPSTAREGWAVALIVVGIVVALLFCCACTGPQRGIGQVGQVRQSAANTSFAQTNIIYAEEVRIDAGKAFPFDVGRGSKLQLVPAP